MNDFIPIMKPIMPAWDDINLRMREAIQSGQITNGKNVRLLEEVIAQQIDAKHVIATNSCTTGLTLAWQVLTHSAREIATTPYTWKSTELAIRQAGYVPTFVDINTRTFLMEDTDATAVMPVHVFGNVRQYEWADCLVVDAAHALGVKGSFQGDISVYSLSPSKIITGGEGGLMATDSDVLAGKLREKVAWAGRMPEVNAIIALENFKALPMLVRAKKALHEEYKAKLPHIGFQEVADDTNFNEIIMLVDSPDAVAQELKQKGIDTRIRYEPLISGLPNADYVGGRSLSIPAWLGVPYDRVINAIKEVVK